MRIVCGPDHFVLPDSDDAIRVILYGQARAEGQGSAGEAARHEVLRRRFQCAQRAWICCQSR